MMRWVRILFLSIIACLLIGIPAFAGSSVNSEVVGRRTQNSKTFYIGDGKYSWEGSMGAIHYKSNNSWLDIDTTLKSSIPPWNWQMVKAGYNIYIFEDFTAGQILKFVKDSESVAFQPMALEWTNDLEQIQQISMPRSVTPNIIDNKISWSDAYGSNIDFEWQATNTRLVKLLTVNSFSALPVPEQYIINGGNPVLRLNLIFDPSNNLNIYVDGVKWDKKNKVQTFDIIEFRKDGEVLWGFMPLIYWDSDGNVEQSVATLKKSGNSLYISIMVPYSWLQNATYPVCIDTDIEEQIDASTDDATRRLVASYFDLAITFSRVGIIAAGDKWGTGQRFITVAIPSGATIVSANMTIQYEANQTLTPVSANLSAENVGDAPTFANDAAAFDARYANHTNAVVDWTPIPNWAANVDIATPDLSAVIQEVIDRVDWASGNDLVIFFEDFEGRSPTNKYRYYYSWDHATGPAAKLYVTYSIPPMTSSAEVLITVSGVTIGVPGDFTVLYIDDETLGLSWSIPEGSDQIEVRYKYGEYPENRYDGTIIYSGNGTYAEHNIDLTGASIPYYRAWSRNTTYGIWAIYSSREEGSFMTQSWMAAILLAFAFGSTLFSFRMKSLLLGVCAGGFWVAVMLFFLEIQDSFVIGWESGWFHALIYSVIGMVCVVVLMQMRRDVSAGWLTTRTKDRRTRSQRSTEDYADHLHTRLYGHPKKRRE